MLRVLAPAYEQGASGYYRVEMPLLLLYNQKRIDALWRNALGVTDARLQDDSYRSRMMDLISWANIIFLERDSRAEIAPIITKCQEAGKKFMMDLDDHVACFSVISEPQVAQYWQEQYPRLLSILALVDGLICTTPRMASYYKPLMRRNAQVFHIPNYIDISAPRWAKAKALRKQMLPNELLTIGWMGGHTHADDLAIIRKALLKAMTTLPIKVKFVGLVPDWASELPQSRVICDSGYTNLDTYPLRYCDLDIGLIPLARNEFNDVGKSDLKFLEFGVLGIPSVVSRSPAYGSVSHKRTGLIVDNNDDEWYTAIKYLVENKLERERLAVNVERYVLRQRTADNNVHRWSSAFKNLYIRS